MRNKLMKSTTRSLAWTALAALLLCTPAQAEMYKWIDEDGVMNYSNRRPNHAQVEEVDLRPINVAHWPKPSNEEVRAMNERLQDRRVLQLEAELAAQRTRPSAPASVPDDSPYYGVDYGYGYGYADDGGRPHRRHHRHDGPRYVVGPGPYGIGAQAIPVPRRETPSKMAAPRR